MTRDEGDTVNLHGSFDLIWLENNPVEHGQFVFGRHFSLDCQR